MWFYERMEFNRMLRLSRRRSDGRARRACLGTDGPRSYGSSQALQRVRDAGLIVEYGPANEPWGVRQFYVRDPLGRLMNILAHE